MEKIIIGYLSEYIPSVYDTGPRKINFICLSSAIKPYSGAKLSSILLIFVMNE